MLHKLRHCLGGIAIIIVANSSSASALSTLVYAAALITALGL